MLIVVTMVMVIVKMLHGRGPFCYGKHVFSFLFITRFYHYRKSMAAGGWSWSPDTVP